LNWVKLEHDQAVGFYISSDALIKYIPIIMQENAKVNFPLYFICRSQVGVFKSSDANLVLLVENIRKQAYQELY